MRLNHSAVARSNPVQYAEHFSESHGEPGPHESCSESDKPQRDDQARQHYGGNIADRPNQAHAMKITRQQRHHAPLDYQRKQNDFPKPQAQAHRSQRGENLRDAPAACGNRDAIHFTAARISIRNCAILGGCMPSRVTSPRCRSPAL